MSKSILRISIGLILIFTAINKSLAQDTLTIADVEFDATTGTIVDYTASYTNIVIPGSLEVDGNRVAVKIIGDQAFFSKSLFAVSIPNTVTHVGESAFSNSSIMHITIPESITSIGMKAFGWNNLTEVNIPDNLKVISTSAFIYNALKNITIPDGVEVIEQSAFMSNSIDSLVIPAGVTEIQSTAFRGNDIQKLYLHDNIKSIGGGAFNSNEIAYVNGKESDGLIYARKSDGSIDSTTIISYGGVSETIDFIPERVKVFGYYAFYGNFIDSIVIPDGVRRFEKNALALNNLKSLILPDSTEFIGEAAFNNNSLTSIQIPGKVTRIGKNAFSGNSLTDIQIGPGVKQIGMGAFYNNSIASLTIPNQVVFIGYIAFHDNALNSVSFEEGSNIRVIARNAFNNNTGLTGITLPENANSGFVNYTDANGLTYSSGDDITDYTLDYYVGLPAYTLQPEDVDFSDGEIVLYYGGYSNIIIPDYFMVNGEPCKVKSLGGSSCYYKGITDIILPAELESIGQFSLCDNLISAVHIPEKTTQIGRSAFSDNKLTNILLPDPVIKEGYSFVEWLDNESAAVTEITDFAVPYTARMALSGYTLSGKINTPHPEFVKLNMTGDLEEKIPVKSDSSYSVVLNPGRTVKLVPQLDSYVFYPDTISIENIRKDTAGVNFSGCRIYKLSGNITGTDDFELIIRGDTSINLNITNAESLFEVYIKENQGISVCFHKNGYRFEPDTLVFKAVNHDSLNMQISAVKTYIIEGSVQGTSQVDILLSGDATDSVRLEDTGDLYKFLIDEGKNVILTPLKQGFTFTPEHIEITGIDSDLYNQNFNAQEITATNNFSFTSMNIYPNPFTNSFTIATNINNYAVEVYNSMGVSVYSGICNERIFKIDLSKHASGIYLVKINHDNEERTMRIVKY